jgi:hypothetical protein
MLASIPVEVPDLEPGPDGVLPPPPPSGHWHEPQQPRSEGGAASWQALWAPTSSVASDDGGANFLLGGRPLRG